MRFSQLYNAADSCRDCDIKKKYAGKKRIKKLTVFTKATKNRLDTVRKQLRTCGIEANKVAKIMTDIKKRERATNMRICMYMYTSSDQQPHSHNSLTVAYLWKKTDNIAQTMTIPTTYDARLNTLSLVDIFNFNFNCNLITQLIEF